MNVLLAEDEKHSQQIRRGLTAEAYAVDIVHDGETAADVLLEGRHDIAIINADYPIGAVSTFAGTSVTGVARPSC